MKRIQASFLVVFMVFVFTSVAVAKQTTTKSKDEKPGAVSVEVTKLTATVADQHSQKPFQFIDKVLKAALKLVLCQLCLAG